MDNSEREKMLEVLRVIDFISSETHKPAELRQIVKSVPNMPSPTVYARVDRGVDYGLLTKGKGENGFLGASVTLKGYRLLGEEPEVFVEPLEAKEGILTYKQAYHIISELFIADEGLIASERKAIVDSFGKLLE